MHVAMLTWFCPKILSKLSSKYVGKRNISELSSGDESRTGLQALRLFITVREFNRFFIS